MPIGIQKLFDDAEKLSDHGRLLPAIEALENARRLTTIPYRRAFATYNLGAIFWNDLGNGLAGRREFLACIADLETHGYGQRPELKVIHANALENAMLCALSFDEFEHFAGTLQTLASEAPILTGLLPLVRIEREGGQSWSDRLFFLAHTYYDRSNPKRDAGRYGAARATYHLILAHRRELRLSREDWRMALLEFCALSMGLCSKWMIVRGGESDPHSPEEFLPILTDAIPFADEYLRLNSGDEGVKGVRFNLGNVIDIHLQRAAVIHQQTNAMKQKTEYLTCQQCGAIFGSRQLGGKALKVRRDFALQGSIGELGSDGGSKPNCSVCGGEVVWKSNHKMAPGPVGFCLALLLLAGILAGILFLWFR